LHLFRQQGQVPVQKLAAVIGQGVALTKAILSAKLLLHNAYCDIAQRANWNSLVPLSTATILDLEDWRHGLLTWNGHLANLRPCNVLLNTDASLTGWGASLGAMLSSPTCTSAGWWPPSKQHHINVLKITAVHNALKSFLPLLQGKAVWISCNNIGRSPPMNNVMHAIHQLCKSSNIQLMATYLPGADNTVADHLSHLWPHHKWQLAPAMVCRLDQLWGPHTIDRTASASNSQLHRFNSQFSEAKSKAVDCLLQDWSKENNWAAPPIALILRILNLVKRQCTMATIIVPKWPGCCWFSHLERLTINTPACVPALARNFRSKS